MSIEEFLALLPDGEQRERFVNLYERYRAYMQAMADDPEQKGEQFRNARLRVMSAMQVFFMTFEEEREG